MLTLPTLAAIAAILATRPQWAHLLAAVDAELERMRAEQPPTTDDKEAD